jgi:sodium-dependent dicarboxylate transporter 2/3/5
VAFLPVALLPALNVLQKKEIRNFPWEVLWLVAGGISLGVSLKENGVADWMLTRVSMDALGPVWAMTGFCLLGYIVANLVSNTVSASILIPLVIGFASGIQMAEADLTRNVILIGIIVSFSMTLPISTPPNAIGMSSGLIDTKDMMKAGLILGVIGGLLLIACALFYWPLFL